MARRSDHTAEELRELILNASIKLIEEKGPGALGTRAIAREIGYSFGTIYHIYGDVEELRYHVKGKILDIWQQVLVAGMAEQKNKPQYLMESYIDFSIEHKNLWAFVFTLPSENRDKAPPWYIEKIENLFAVVVDAFRDVIPDARKAKAAANALWPAIHGVCALSMSHKLEMVSDTSPRELSHQLLTTYMKGLESVA